MKKFITFLMAITLSVLVHAQSFNLASTNTEKNLNGFSNYIAVGDSGTILRTTDVINWSLISSGTTRNLYDVKILNNNGLAVGAAGTILRTTDLGLSWEMRTSGTSAALRGVSFPVSQPLICVAVGDSGTILQSSDGGVNWIQRVSGITDNLNSVFMIDQSLGLTVGADGSMLRTNDGGESWTEVNTGLTKTIRSITFAIYNGTGMIIGDGGLVYRTTDNGGTWYDYYRPDPRNFYCTAFAGVYWITGEGSWAMKYTNQWELVPLNPGGIALNAIGVGITNRLVIVGSSGTIFYTILPIPVELVSFTASRDERKINLIWTTGSEVNSRGFEIERKNNDAWRIIGFVSGHGTTTEMHSYAFTDEITGLQTGSTLSYRLKQKDFDGSYEYSKEIEITFTPGHTLDQNYPNPFNPLTTISYSISAAGIVSLKVYDALGREVRSLLDQEKAAGNYKVDFNAEGLTSGIYFYQLVTEQSMLTKKMTILK